MTDLPGPHPTLREAIREVLTADRDTFRAGVERLGADHGFGTDRLATEPASFDPPEPVKPVTGRRRRLVWRAWVLADAPLGVVLTGAAYHDNPVVYATPATRQLTGYTLAELCGENLRRLQGPATAPAQVDALRDALRGWRPTTVELGNERADGTRFRNRVSLVPTFDATGTVDHWFGLQAAVGEGSSGGRE